MGANPTALIKQYVVIPAQKADPYFSRVLRPVDELICII